MWPDRVSNPGPLTYESCALPTALAAWLLRLKVYSVECYNLFHTGQMRSLRVFYSNPENTQGQIVIASRESQYKILHFHHGGLDKLAEIFQDWSLFAHAQEKQVSYRCKC